MILKRYNKREITKRILNVALGIKTWSTATRAPPKHRGSHSRPHAAHRRGLGWAPPPRRRSAGDWLSPGPTPAGTRASQGLGWAQLETEQTRPKREARRASAEPSPPAPQERGQVAPVQGPGPPRPPSAVHSQCLLGPGRDTAVRPQASTRDTQIPPFK